MVRSMLFYHRRYGRWHGHGRCARHCPHGQGHGKFTVGVVIKPFEWEGGRRMKNADAALTELEANVDSLVVVLNEKLLEVVGDD